MKITVFLLIAFCIHSTACFGQRTAIKINILSPVVKTFNVALEHAFWKKSSLQVGFFYSAATIKSFKITGIAFTPECRFYLTGSAAPKGVYAAPFVRYRNFELKKEGSNAEADFTSLGGGIVFGHQWVFRERVTLDIFLGPSYSSHKLKIKVGLPEDFKLPGLSGFGLRTGITFGVAF